MAEVKVNRGNVYEPQPQARRYDINEGQDISLTCDIEVRDSDTNQRRVSVSVICFIFFFNLYFL